MKAVEYRNIRMDYGDTVIIKDFNLSVLRGEFVTIIGSSGCGKTTILKMVNGLIRPVRGDILVHGENIKDTDLTMLRRNIGYAIQGSVLFPHMTVEKNISYVPNLLNKRDKERTAGAVSPDILLMDEPFGAVDEITRSSLQDEIVRIHKETGITILFVTHDINEALKLGTKVLVMDQGEIQQFSEPEKLLNHPQTEFVRQLVERERLLWKV